MPEKLFPIVDISYLSNNFEDSAQWKDNIQFQNDLKIKQLAQELRAGFETWGFLYIKGHNIPDNLVNNVFGKSKTFFDRPYDHKSKYPRGEGIGEGWLGPENEVFDSSLPRDMKEAFDFRPNTEIPDKLSKDMPNLVGGMTELFDHCTELSLKFLRLLAVALDIDTEKYAASHSNMGRCEKNGTSLRSLYYPAIKDTVITDKDRRCREHTDYGTITLLFQDEVGGLEVLSPTGEFVKAVPIPGSIVINAGDMLKDWSHGQYKATIHRVVTPTDQNKCTIARQSMAFFCHPNFDIDIGENEEKINVFDHISKRFNETIIPTN
eukprot:TCONS_00063313-protein